MNFFFSCMVIVFFVAGIRSLLNGFYILSKNQLHYRALYGRMYSANPLVKGFMVKVHGVVYVINGVILSISSLIAALNIWQGRNPNFLFQVMLFVFLLSGATFLIGELTKSKLKN